MAAKEVTFRFAAPDDAAILVVYLETLRAEALDTIHPPQKTVEEEREILQGVQDNLRGKPEDLIMMAKVWEPEV